MNPVKLIFKLHLRKDEEGCLVYFPWGRLGKGYFVPDEPEMLEQIFTSTARRYLVLPLSMGFSLFVAQFIIQRDLSLPMRIDESLLLAMSMGYPLSVILSAFSVIFSAAYCLLLWRHGISQVTVRLESCDKRYTELPYSFDY